MTRTKIYGRTDGDGRDVPETTTPCQRKQHFVQYKGKHSKIKEVYMDGSKSTGRKVGYETMMLYMQKASEEGNFQNKSHSHN